MILSKFIYIYYKQKKNFFQSDFDLILSGNFTRVYARVSSLFYIQ